VSKLAQRQILAKIVPSDNMTQEKGPNVDGYFAQVSGGEITASVEKIYVGGETFPEVLCAPAEIGDITLTKHFDTADVASGAFLPKLRQLVGRVYYDITVYTLDCDLKVPGSDRVYPKCLLVGLSEPDGDSSSGAPAVFALTFSVSSVAAPR
jgi:hypothetical protein